MGKESLHGRKWQAIPMGFSTLLGTPDSYWVHFAGEIKNLLFPLIPLEGRGSDVTKSMKK
jgi:hypothetical protein